LVGLEFQLRASHMQSSKAGALLLDHSSSAF
jgi:hypothetical protein